MIQVVQAQVGIAKANRREHRIVLAKVSVGGDVHDPARWPVSPQNRFRSGLADKQFRIGQESRAGPRLLRESMEPARRQCQGSASPPTVFAGLLAAQRVNAGAGCIGDGELVDQIILAIVKRVKRNVVQQSMRSENQMLAPRADRRSGQSIPDTGSPGVLAWICSIGS